MKALSILVLMCISMVSWSQVPQAIKYQGVIRSNNGDLLSDSTFVVKITIRDVSFNGPVIYEENHNATTNAFGSFSLNIGQGSNPTSDFATIDWGAGNKYLEQSVDFGNGYVSTGAMQFLSVPYALHAGNGLPAGGTAGQVLTIDANGNFVWTNPENIGNTTPTGSSAKTLVFTADGF